MARTFLPASDSALLLWAQNFSTLLTANSGAYGLLHADAVAYADLLTTYQTALTAAKADATRGKSTVYAKKQAKIALVASTRSIAGQINRTMTVTDQQRTDLGLIVRKNPTPVPTPIVTPGMMINSVVGRTVNASVYDATSATKRNKPKNVVGAKLYTFVGATYPSDPSLWAYMGDFTRVKFAFTVPNTVASGAQIWVCAAFYNRKGETGPTNCPVTTNIQGGGSMEEQSELKIAA